MNHYLRNTWYVAAWSADIQDTPFSRTVLDEPIVFYRKEDKSVVALRDRCPHRFVPLSRGKVEGDHLICGYHGLRFASSGDCEDPRFGQRLCDSAKIKSYPVVERFGAIWIWMGEAGRENSNSIPDFSFLENSGVNVYRGTTKLDAHYSLEIDNLMDLSHLDYVHMGGIGNGGLSKGQYTSKQEGGSVHSNWWTPNCPCPDQFKSFMQGQDFVDQWNEMRWDAPAIVYLYNGVTKLGQPKSDGYEVRQAHFVLPETSSSSYYLWAVTLPDNGESPEFQDYVRSVIVRTFEDEDKPMLEAQQKAMKASSFWEEKPISFPEDSGAIRARRLLDQLIENEQREGIEAVSNITIVKA